MAELEVNPGSLKAAVNLSQLERRRARPEEAARVLASSREHHPDEPVLALLLGYATLESGGNLDKVEALANEALGADVTRGATSELLQVVRRRSGEQR